MKYYLFNTGQYVENYVLWGDLRSKFNSSYYYMSCVCMEFFCTKMEVCIT